MKQEQWLYEITPKKKFFSFNFKEIWRYRDLLWLFVKRDVVTVYKQTVLGPLWYIVQPVLSSVTNVLIFGVIAGVSFGNVPSFLFMMAGQVCWSYFSECFTGTADTFKRNQGIFGKVYFPRMIMPLSIVFSKLFKFFIQFLIFVVFYLYFIYNGTVVRPSKLFFLFPVIIMIMGFVGLGMGMIVSSMVTKYRDLVFLIGFGVRILSMISLVQLPYSKFKEMGYEAIVDYNPLATTIETTRFLLFGEGNFSWQSLGFVGLFAVGVLFVGLLLFNRTEKTFIDTI